MMHVDVHLYNNRSYPFAVAYRRLIKKYNIQTARYYGVHHKTQEYPLKEKVRLWVSSVLCGHQSYVCKSCTIDYFLSRRSEFKKDKMVELYVHPDYIDGILIDNSESVFGHEKRTLEQQIEDIRKETVLISWNQVKSIVTA